MFKVLSADGKSVGIKKGDVILSFDGKAPADILDYEFYDGCESFTVETQRGMIEVSKRDYETLGLTFDEETYLKSAACRNKCVFCFVDQLPKGMRSSLYFKDDDWRLSFVSGNYVTFTNLTESDIERICEKKFSPLYVSVHTTDDGLRRKMLQNSAAAAIMPLLKRFADCGIQLHAQIVLCPGINDGEVLQKTLEDLQNLNSVAVVPVGLTQHREKLTYIEPVSREKAMEVIEITERFDFAYCSDEFYLKAELPLPPFEYYGNFSQIENGVGLLAKFEREFNDALQFAKKARKGGFTVVTGVDAANFIERLVSSAKQQFPQITCNVLAVKNEFFGESVTVAGLVTAQDIVAQAKGKTLKTVLLPQTMLRQGETVFLDGTTVKELGKALRCKIKVIHVDGGEFAAALLKG